MELRRKVARMALGYDKYELVKGKAEVFPAKESTDYVDSLVAFHKDVMKFLRSLNVYVAISYIPRLIRHVPLGRVTVLLFLVYHHYRIRQGFGGTS